MRNNNRLPNFFFKTSKLKDIEKNGKLVKLEELSDIVASLREAEEKRRKILILAKEKDKNRYRRNYSKRI